MSARVGCTPTAACGGRRGEFGHARHPRRRAVVGLVVTPTATASFSIRFTQRLVAAPLSSWRRVPSGVALLFTTSVCSIAADLSPPLPPPRCRWSRRRPPPLATRLRGCLTLLCHVRRAAPPLRCRHWRRDSRCRCPCGRLHGRWQWRVPPVPRPPRCPYTDGGRVSGGGHRRGPSHVHVRRRGGGGQARLAGPRH